jgi:2-polyprenyl-3-methyl-5-hydroxy-6-metoxy-1,4-benzoquinol methylase
MSKQDQIEKMRQINEAQRGYYEEASGHATSDVNSPLTNLYRRLRNRAFSVLEATDVNGTVTRLHRSWCPDLSTKKVLDLGSGSGTSFSIELAQQCQHYVATDLSSSRLEALRRKLADADVDDFTLVQGDFLDSDFPESGFDVVYAHSVLHHFEHIAPFLDMLHSRMHPGGIILSRDPLQTWPPYRIFRQLYRPFQTDSAWEYPFDRQSLSTIQDYFTVDEVQGLFGRSKWAVPLALVSLEKARQVARRQHERDLQEATSLSTIDHCLQVVMRLSKDA